MAAKANEIEQKNYMEHKEEKETYTDLLQIKVYLTKVKETDKNIDQEIADTYILLSNNTAEIENARDEETEEVVAQPNAKLLKIINDSKKRSRMKLKTWK